MEKILVIAAHPDDEILGCGGTIKRLIDEGNEAYSLILSDGTTSRHGNLTEVVLEEIKNRLKQSQAAAKIIGYKELFFCQFVDNSFDKDTLLDIVKAIEKYIVLLKPSIIFTHHYGDLNIDHQRTFQAVQTASRPMVNCPVKELYCFETFSATEWSFIDKDKFVPNYFVNIETTLKDKLQAIKCYKSELRQFPHPRSIEGLETAARRWGTVIGCNYAEAFELVRKIIP
ncbi:PIG-L family deacetylase [Clostridium sp. CX1]|uniref:PIG-L deacetylase family protein n=1 Tax=Clostridium sp. CX1 TaxID=2978346 RepID=UPI0021BFAEB5|nr:PIG-L family deacetylase [Clostridium sp. CX1]MCT8977412.1 PIG-L family deacetylase [Clostridium sp. CX1]